jgi:malate dehydrogenase (oxaloacetate-decarboxylating)
MVLAASYALAEYTAERHPDAVYPPVNELREVSRYVAERVFLRAFEDGVAEAAPVPKNEVAALVAKRFWKPAYWPVVRG